MPKTYQCNNCRVFYSRANRHTCKHNRNPTQSPKRITNIQNGITAKLTYRKSIKEKESWTHYCRLCQNKCFSDRKRSADHSALFHRGKRIKLMQTNTERMQVLNLPHNMQDYSSDQIQNLLKSGTKFQTLILEDQQKGQIIGAITFAKDFNKVHLIAIDSLTNRLNVLALVRAFEDKSAAIKNLMKTWRIVLGQSQKGVQFFKDMGYLEVNIQNSGKMILSKFID